MCLAVVMSPHDMGLEGKMWLMGIWVVGTWKAPQEKTELLDSRISLHSNSVYTPPAIFDIGTSERLYQGSKPYPIYGEHFTHHQGPIAVAIMPRATRVLCFYSEVQNQEQLWFTAASRCQPLCWCSTEKSGSCPRN